MAKIEDGLLSGKLGGKVYCRHPKTPNVEDPGKEFVCRYLMIGAQDYKHVSRWAVGASREKINGGQAVKRIDDFMVWDQALSSEQVKKLYLCSKGKDPNPSCWGQPVTPQAVIAATEEKDNQNLQQISTEEEEVSSNRFALEPVDFLKVYPNPSPTGKFTAEVYLEKDSWLNLLLTDLKGVVLMNKREQLIKAGKYTIALDNLNIGCSCSGNGSTSGMYILKVATNTFTKSAKLIRNRH
ncbi:T9SS type A sorting domain-containing protein [Desertivirga xinjiangensis]|uniref:T9SS type A sorting domain-containing protein n=1 Tax=Desertivirga xinjiangensis TaxID=539206 RepID=UPI00210C7BA8|nr:T9SS type A sorting domain-containing protein [Pedobacter xinjiangensis]